MNLSLSSSDIASAALRQGEAVLTRACLSAARTLGFSQGRVSELLGLPIETVAAMETGRVRLERGTEEAERAAQLVQLHLALVAVVGSDERRQKQWLHTHNPLLQAQPMALLATREGMSLTLGYLAASC